MLEEAKDINTEQREELKLGIAIAEGDLGTAREIINQVEDPVKKCIAFLEPAAKKAGISPMGRFD